MIQRFSEWTEDVHDECTGRTSTIPTVRNATRAEELASEQRQATVRDLCAKLELSVRTIHYAVNQEMEYRKMCARWVA